VLAEDSADYTCQIDGPDNTVIANVTHSVLVSGLSICPSICYDTIRYIICTEKLTGKLPV